MVRSIAGVVCGVAGWGIVFISLTYALAAVRPGTFAEEMTTSDPINLVILLLLSFVVSTGMGWLSGVIARLQKAVIAVAVINLVIGIFVQGSAWDTAPVWYHIPFLLGVVPFTLFGGTLSKK